MHILSKLAYQTGQPILAANCYEVIHTWNPNCYGAIWDAIPNGIRFSLKTYFSFYLVTNVFAKRGRVDKIKWKKFFLDVLQSSAFLTTNMILFLFFLCRFRHLLGFFTPFSMGLISSILASGIAIFIEKKSRRPALALYLTNLASETFFRHLTLHGYVKSFKNGECIPFAIGLMIFAYLQSSGRLPSTYKGMLNIALNSDVQKPILPEKKLSKEFSSFLNNLRHLHDKTELCNHPYSCVSHSFESFFKNFSVGVIISSILTLLRNLGLVTKNPLKFPLKLLSIQNMRIPVFAGLLTLIFNALRCVLNRFSKNTVFNDTVSAGIAASSMIVFPNVSIAMFWLWKGIETLYFDQVERGNAPLVKYGEIWLYAVTTGYVLWNVIVEPRALRRGYLNFLNGLVGGKIAAFNRRLYDHFGYVHRDIFDTVPNLNAKFVSINPLLT